VRSFSARFCRLAFAAAVTPGLVLFGAGPASAHVEAEAEAGAQAGDGPVTITVTAEAESSTASITSAKTQLSEWILPEWVSLASGPPDVSESWWPRRGFSYSM
jgi:hypothetical protein